METKKQEEKRLHLLILKHMLTLATAAFGLVAALAWNSVIQEAVNTYIKPFLPKGSGIITLVLYAIIITVIAVIVTYQLTKLIDTLES